MDYLGGNRAQNLISVLEKCGFYRLNKNKWIDRIPLIDWMKIW